LGRFSVKTPYVPPTPPTPVPSPGGGGSGGGGVGPSEQPVEEEALKILGTRFDKNIELDAPLNIFVKVENIGKKALPFNLSVEIKQGDSVLYSEKVLVPVLRAGETREIMLDRPWTPVLSGSYRVLTEAVSLDKEKVFSRLVEKFIVGGGVWRYDISVECLKKEVKTNETADARIMLLNLGNYFEDTALEWWVEDSKGTEIGKSAFTLALYPDENRLFSRQVFIPEGTPEGSYVFKAKIKYGEFLQTSFCSFAVKGTGSFENALAQIQKSLSELDSAIAKAKETGMDVSAEEYAASVLKTGFDDLKNSAAKGEAAVIPQKTQDILNGIGGIYDKLYSKKLWFGLVKILEILVLVQLSLIIALLLLYYSPKKFFDRAMRLNF
ncbi:MAG: hypothetical protein PHH08_03760, partial [Candidatus ainarchaeum sp.]|nr:hypothetical protein [Candidatus ainarchaeum sp.]